MTLIKGPRILCNQLLSTVWNGMTVPEWETYSKERSSIYLWKRTEGRSPRIRNRRYWEGL